MSWQRTVRSIRAKWFIKIWANSDYFDLWDINHFLAGVLCAGIVVSLRMNLWNGLFLSVLAMLAWEIYEVLERIKESPFNRIMDVALGIAGFFIFYSVRDTAYFYPLGVVALILWVILELWGYAAYKNGASKL